MMNMLKKIVFTVCYSVIEDEKNNITNEKKYEYVTLIDSKGNKFYFVDGHPSTKEDGNRRYTSAKNHIKKCGWNYRDYREFKSMSDITDEEIAEEIKRADIRKEENERMCAFYDDAYNARSYYERYCR